jgi:hypothetical protein
MRHRRQCRPTRIGLAVFACAVLPGCGSQPANDANGNVGWGPPIVLGAMAINDSPRGVSLSGDGAGRSVAVWVPATTTTPEVLARTFSPSSGWMPVETVAPAGTGSAGTPSVRMNRRGDAVAMWEIFGGISASVRSANGRWDHRALVGDTGVQARRWSFGLDDAGNALLAVSAAPSGVHTRRYEPSSGWGPFGAIPGADDVEFGLEPALAVSGTGTALLAWATTGGEVLGSVFEPGTGWSFASRLSSQPTAIYALNVFVNARGDGVVTWYGNDPINPGSGALFASLYENPTGFRRADRLGPAVGSTLAAAVAPQNTSLVIYMTGLGLRAQRHTSAAGWSAPEPVEGVGGFDAVTLDDQGDGWIFWSEPGPSNQGIALRSRRLLAGRATGVVEEIAPPTPGLAWFRGVSLDSQGGVSTAWFRLLSEPTSGGGYAFVAGRYDPR